MTNDWFVCLVNDDGFASAIIEIADESIDHVINDDGRRKDLRMRSFANHIDTTKCDKNNQKIDQTLKSKTTNEFKSSNQRKIHQKKTISHTWTLWCRANAGTEWRWTSACEQNWTWKKADEEKKNEKRKWEERDFLFLFTKRKTKRTTTRMARYTLSWVMNICNNNE